MKKKRWSCSLVKGREGPRRLLSEEGRMEKQVLHELRELFDGRPPTGTKGLLRMRLEFKQGLQKMNKHPV